MSDPVTPLAARWIETRDAEDATRYLEALREVGRLRRASVEVAAWLGEEAARGLLGSRGELFRPRPELAAYLELLPGDEAVKGRAALTVLELVAQLAPDLAAAHPIGQKVLRALDSEDPPTVERLLTARAGARRTPDALWSDMIQWAHACLPGPEAVEPLAHALRDRLLPWVLVRPDPGGAPLEGFSRVPPVFDAPCMTAEAARAVLAVPAEHPFDSPEGKEAVQDYLLSLGWKRDVSGLTAPAGDQRLKFDMTARRLALLARQDDGWGEAWSSPLFLDEVAGRLVQQAEDTLRAAGEAHPTKRPGRVRRRQAGETRKAAWTSGGPPTLAQLDQIAELQRGTSEAHLLEVLQRVAGVESVGDLRRETAGKIILALSGFG